MSWNSSIQLSEDEIRRPSGDEKIGYWFLDTGCWMKSHDFGKPLIRDQEPRIENPVTMTLLIDFTDMVRATLDEDCGNEGYIGISPEGSRYHVVVPVDRQIARGIKAGNRPMDETPFGGYKDWHYFCCLGFTRPGKVNETEIQKARRKQARVNARLLKAWAAGKHLEVEFNTSGTG